MLKKFALSLCLIACLVHPLFSEELTMDALEKRLSSLETTHPFPQGGFNPPASLAYGVGFSADVLYWQARENGTAYAIQFEQNPQASPLQTNTFKDLNFDWDFGFRIGAGYTFLRDEWSLDAEWTHFITKAQDLGRSFRSDPLIPIWSSPTFAPQAPFADYAKARWRLHFNTLTLTLSRPFKVSRYLVMTPAIGPSGLWIEQHYHLKYTLPPLSPGYSHVHLKNAFEAIGLYAGLETRFGFRWGVSVFNQAALSLYYGEFDLKRKETFTPAATPDRVVRDQVKKEWRTVAPVIQMALGLRFDHTFAHNRMAIAIKLCYEYGIYFSQNQFLRLLTPNAGVSFAPTQGDLTISGGTLSAGMIF